MSNQKKRTRSKQNSKQPTPERQERTTDFIVEPQNSGSANKRTEAEADRTTPKRLVSNSNWWMVALTAALCLITWLQWRAARVAISLTLQSIQQSDRPVIVVDRVSWVLDGRRHYIAVHFVNRGRGAALKLRISVNAFVTTRPSMMLPVGEGPDAKEGNQTSIGTLGVADEGVAPIMGDTSLPDTVGKGKSEALFENISGFIKYDDVFANTFSERLCFYYDARLDAFMHCFVPSGITLPNQHK